MQLRMPLDALRGNVPTLPTSVKAHSVDAAETAACVRDESGEPLKARVWDSTPHWIWPTPSGERAGGETDSGNSEVPLFGSTSEHSGWNSFIISSAKQLNIEVLIMKTCGKVMP